MVKGSIRPKQTFVTAPYRPTPTSPLAIVVSITSMKEANATRTATVKTAKGQKKVIAWLKMLENQSAQQHPEDPMGAYDFTWLWRELGVGDERR